MMYVCCRRIRWGRGCVQIAGTGKRAIGNITNSPCVPYRLSICQRLFSNVEKSVEGEKRWVLKSDIELETIDDAIAENNWVLKPLAPNEISEIDTRLGVNEKVADDGKVRSASQKGTSSINVIKYKEDYFKVDKDSYHQRIKGFLDWVPSICSGCGTPFQTKSPNSPGYLSKEKFTEHNKKCELIRKQQEAVQLLDVAGIATDSPLAVEILISAGTPQEVIDGVIKLGKISKSDDNSQKVMNEDDNANSSIENVNKSQGGDIAKSSPPVDKSIVFGYDPDTLEPIYDLETFRDSFKREKRATYESFKTSPTKSEEDEKSLSICQRCFRLQMYGDVEDNLRPGWSDHDLLTPERFAELLSQIKTTKAVVLCLIDIFDVEGSLLSNLHEIAGRNPIVIAANKVDLLPKDAVLGRVNDWVYSSAKQHCGLLSPKEAEMEDQQELANKGWYRSRLVGSGSNREAVVGILRRSDVHLMSCETGSGVSDTLRKVIGLASKHGEKIYVMGTANVGKSSFINRLLEYTDSNDKRSKRKKHKRSNIMPQATVSNLPGTTLDFLKISLPNGITVYDTPGLINYGQLTSRLTTQELRQVIPKKRVNHITIRMEKGRVIMIGGIARVEHVEVSLIRCINI